MNAIKQFDKYDLLLEDPEEMRLVLAIANRYIRLVKGKPSQNIHRVMDLCAVHKYSCKLDLEGLLKASNFDLCHDVGGIAKHLNRETGELEDCFLPRYAQHD